MAKELRIEIIVDAATGTATLKQFDKTLGDVEKKAGGPVNDALTKLDKTTQGLGGTMGKLGSYLAGFFTVTAILGAIRGASDFADSLVKLSDKTGIEIDALQRLKATAENSGNSLEQVAQGVAMMSARIGKGGEETETALTRIGLSAERLKAMKPEEQFVEIARALSAVTTQADRDALGMAILGRSYLELKPTLKAAKDGLDEVAGASEASVRGFDRLGDAVVQFYEQRIKGGLVSALGGAVVFVDHLRDSVSHLAKGELHEGILALTLYDEKLLKVVDSLGLVERAQREVADRGFKPAVLSAKELAGIEDELTASAERQIEANKQLTIAQKARADAMKAMSGQAILDQANEAVAAYLAISKQGLIPTEEEQAKLNKLVTDAIAIYDRAGREVPRDLKGIEESTRAVIVGTQTWQKAARLAVATADNPQYQHLYDGLLASVDAVEEKFLALPAAIKGSYEAVEEAGKSWSEGFLEIARGFPDLVVSAFTGGGGMSGLTRALGSQVGAMFGDMLGSSLAKSIGGMLGKTLGAIMPGIGAMLGPALEWVSGKLLKTEGKKVNDLRDAYVAAAGGIAELDRKAKAAGMSLDALLRAKTVKDYEAAVASLNTALEKTAKLQGELAGLQQQLADRSVLDLEKAEAIAAKYGGTVATLGQAFVQAKANADWKSVIDDFETLRDMGADVGGTLAMMSEEISTLVQTSIRMGTEIPENMRPYLEELARSGQLLDENGKAMTDLSNIKWGEALVSDLDLLISKIDALVEALTGHLIPAIGQIPERVNVKVGYEYENYEPGGYTGGATAHKGAYVGDGGLARYHAGGVARGLVPRYHLGADEVPAILQAGEGVLSRHVGMPAIGGRATLRALNTGQARLGPVEIGGGGGALLAEIRALAASMQAVAARPVQAATYLDGRKVSKNQVRYIPGTLTKAGR